MKAHLASDQSTLGHRALATVLVIEDAATLIDLLVAERANAGLRVATAGDNRQALAALEGVPPDGMVLDLAQPDVSRDRLMELLTRDPVMARVSVLILTAVRVEQAQPALMDSAADFRRKPLQIDDLATRGQQVLTD